MFIIVVNDYIVMRYVVLSKHLIILSSWDWCREASKGNVKVYDFIKPKKKGLRAIGPGSVCVVLTLAERGIPQTFFGEFRVVEVKEVDAEEYNRLTHLIYRPQRLKPGERRWIIRFEDFIEYPRKVPRRELTDVKTSTSKKPISDWIITGRAYIDDQALEGIRKKCGYYEIEASIMPIQSIEERLNNIEARLSQIELVLGISKFPFLKTHECLECMLLEIGKMLGFKVYTADPSKTCGNVRLGDLTNMSREDLGKFVGPIILDPLSKIDVVWYKRGSYYAFEVVVSTGIRDALDRLLNISDLNAQLYVIADEDKQKEFEKRITSRTFRDIKDRCKFITIAEVFKMYMLTRLWTQAVKDLQLPFISK